VLKLKNQAIWQCMPFLDIAMRDLQNPLEEIFGDIWEEIYALVCKSYRICTPKKSGKCMDRLYNIPEISPSLNPKKIYRQY